MYDIKIFVCFLWCLYTCAIHKTISRFSNTYSKTWSLWTGNYHHFFYWKMWHFFQVSYEWFTIFMASCYNTFFIIILKFIGVENHQYLWLDCRIKVIVTKWCQKRELCSYHMVSFLRVKRLSYQKEKCIFYSRYYCFVSSQIMFSKRSNKHNAGYWHEFLNFYALRSG